MSVKEGSSNNHNLDELRRLIDRLENKTEAEPVEYQKVTIKIKDLVESGSENVKNTCDLECKLKCYESIFASILAVLTSTKDYV